MQNDEYAARVEDIRQRAHGRWTDILRSMGVGEQILLKRNGPCPRCGGTDRFQYTDKFGEGNYHCRGCGPGGGFKLLQAVTGQDFGTVLRQVEEQVGSVKQTRQGASHEPSPASLKKLAQRLWDQARPIVEGDEVDRYLRGRGLKMARFPKVLRFHPSLGYFQRINGTRVRKVAEYPAMLACVQGEDGSAVSLHRTYLQDGRKLPAFDAKKVLASGISGAAVRLCNVTSEMAVAEGVETALAVHLATGKPVWAGLSAGNLERLWIPESVDRVCIYADNDADGDFAGQYHAFALARRLRRQGMPKVRVFLPRTAGSDWADVWQVRCDQGGHQPEG